MSKKNSMPCVKLGSAEISRLIVGGNPFSGNSHVNRELDEQMRDYYTTENIKETLRECEKNGVNTVQLRADMHIMRILREYWNEGGSVGWIAQTASEYLSHEGNLRQIRGYDRGFAIYHHGTLTDRLFKEGKTAELRERLKKIRETGAAVGIGTHMPQVIETAEAEGWDVDFYMASVYNLSRENRESSAVTGRANTDEPFFDEDIPLMYKTIRSTEKTCLAFKILGATRRCMTPETVENAFREAYANIKASDAVVVGVFQRDRNEVQINSDIVRRVLGVC